MEKKLDDYGYRSKKLKMINDIQNVKDNAMFIFAMFDLNNQRKLLSMVTPETRQAIFDRIKSGGGSLEYFR